jgi:hypothetical protein
LNNKAKKAALSDKNAWLEDLANQAKLAANMGDQRKLYQISNTITGKSSYRPIIINDINGKAIEDQLSRQKRWIEYFDQLLNRDKPTSSIQINNSESIKTNISVLKPNKAEVEKAIAQLKNNKSAGEDNISSEMLKIGGSASIELMHKLCEDIWLTEEPPTDFKKGVIIPLYKKADKLECKNYRGITLLSIPGKVMSLVILNRIKADLDSSLRENQAGFRPGRSCTDQIFSIKQIIERCVEFDIPIELCFIDFKAAFDSLDREVLWQLLDHYGIPAKIINIIKNTYKDSSCKVKVEGCLTDSFNIKTGVRQGCIWSPLLFNIVIDWVLRTALDNKNSGFTLQERYDKAPIISQVTQRQSERLKIMNAGNKFKIADLDFADDIGLLESTKHELQDSINQIVAAAKTTGLIVNIEKTKIMSIKSNDETAILIDGIALETVEKFTYLGSTVSSDNSVAAEIKTRIGKAYGALQKHNTVWKRRSLSLKVKIQMYQAIVLSTLLYGSETWNLTQQQEAQLDAFGHKALRRIMGVEWDDYLSNEEIRRKTNQPKISQLVRKKRQQWFGHVVRMEDKRLAKRTFRWNPKSNNYKRGRKKTRWKDVIQRDAELFNTTPEYLNQIALKRNLRTAKGGKEWLRFLDALCVESNTAAQTA